MEIILGLLLLYLIYLFFTKVVPVLIKGGIAISKVVLIVTLIIGVIYGMIAAFICYSRSMKKNFSFRSWNWKAGTEPAKRSYFFGPGYNQLFRTVKGSYGEIRDLVSRTHRKLKKFRADHWLISKAVTLLFELFMSVSVFIFGTILVTVFSVVHFTITFLFMCLIYVFFTASWLLDRIYLLLRRIRVDCPTCKEHYLIPMFECPSCHKKHRKLYPGPYGIWSHRCECGALLPCTFLNGRSSLKGFCPKCGSELVDTGVTPMVFQLIGGTGSGKTVYLSSFFHQYLEQLRSLAKVKAEITEEYQPYFDELERYYQGGASVPTPYTNSQMYPVLVDCGLGSKRQFSVYDVAGELFNTGVAGTGVDQLQFEYCDGFLILVDPFSTPWMKDRAVKSGQQEGTFSAVSTENVIGNFIRYISSLGLIKTGERCDIPVAVLIAKADISVARERIGPEAIQDTYDKNRSKYADLKAARDEICLQFLRESGLSAAVNELNAGFRSIHYYPVSAIGHTPNGMINKPWGALDWTDWLVREADPDYYRRTTPTRTRR